MGCIIARNLQFRALRRRITMHNSECWTHRPMVLMAAKVTKLKNKRLQINKKRFNFPFLLLTLMSRDVTPLWIDANKSDPTSVAPAHLSATEGWAFPSFQWRIEISRKGPAGALNVSLFKPYLDRGSPFRPQNIQCPPASVCACKLHSGAWMNSSCTRSGSIFKDMLMFFSFSSGTPLSDPL